MLESLRRRLAGCELQQLVPGLTARLTELGEPLARAAVERHLRELVTDEQPERTYLGAVEHRLRAIAATLDELEARPGATASTVGALAGATAASTPSSTTAAPPGLDLATLRAQVRGLAGVVVGPPRIDRGLLDGRGLRTFVWLEDERVVAIGPALPQVIAACAPTTVEAPTWLASWQELTAAGRNPWQLAGDARLDAALDRTAAATPRDPYRNERPRATFEAALAEWTRGEIARLGQQLAATVEGELVPVRDEACRQSLLGLASRAASLSSGALVPLLLAEVASGPLVQVTPLPPGLALDVIGRAAAGYVRVRVVRMTGAPTSLRAIALPNAPRGATSVDGGDVLVTLLGP